jgi:hypothetical protein
MAQAVGLLEQIVAVANGFLADGELCLVYAGEVREDLCTRARAQDEHRERLNEGADFLAAQFAVGFAVRFRWSSVLCALSRASWPFFLLRFCCVFENILQNGIRTLSPHLVRWRVIWRDPVSSMKYYAVCKLYPPRMVVARRRFWTTSMPWPLQRSSDKRTQISTSGFAYTILQLPPPSHVLRSLYLCSVVSGC